VPARDLIEETLILARNISYLSPPYKSQDLLPGSYTVIVGRSLKLNSKNVYGDKICIGGEIFLMHQYLLKDFSRP